MEFVSSYIDRGIPVDIVFLDFQKAFDKVSHMRLLAKVKSIRINGLHGVQIDRKLVER